MTSSVLRRIGSKTVTKSMRIVERERITGFPQGSSTLGIYRHLSFDLWKQSTRVF
jgi:hypothetical protein